MTRKRIIAALLLALAALSFALPVDALGLRDRLRERMAKRFAEQIEADKVSGGRDIAYGANPLQHLSFWAPTKRGSGSVPLILFVHGGGWRMGDRENATGKAKVAHFPAQGYALASANYRLVPDATVEEQATDIASAVKWIVDHAGELNVDSRRVVLMGHSAGAHLVALVGTDPRYLRAVGLSEQSIAGVIPIDGAAYDVPAQLAAVANLPDSAQLFNQMFSNAFGNDSARQRALSPTFQAASPNAPAFLILHVQRRDGIAQSHGLAEALRKAGTPVEIKDFEGKGLRGHMTINRSLGDPDYPATTVVDKWLRATLGS